jgi:Abortive infection alpha
MLGTEVRLWAWKRQLTLLRKAQDHLRKLGKDPRKVNLNLLFPLLAAGGLKEDEEMADRWAALLANAADPAADEVPPSFPEVLKQLTPAEARLLDAIYPGHTGDLTSLAQQLGLGSQFFVAVDNLVRHQLIRHPFRAGPVASQDTARAYVTALGRAFVEACRR